jgi:hypothetical protein
MLDGGAGQARRLEAVLRDASTRATCIVAAAASFCQLVDNADLHVIDGASFERSAAPERYSSRNYEIKFLSVDGAKVATILHLSMRKAMRP